MARLVSAEKDDSIAVNHGRGDRRDGKNSDASDPAGQGDYLMKNAAAKGSEQPLSLPFRLPDVEKCRFFLILV
jgi:hypothetical protein